MKKTLLREQEREEVVVELTTEEPEVEEVVVEAPKVVEKPAAEKKESGKKPKDISDMFKPKK